MIKKKLSVLTFASLFFAPELSFAQTIPTELLQNPNTPLVTVGGFINFTAATQSQETEYEGTRLPDARIISGNGNNAVVDAQHAGTHNRYSNDYAFANDSEIYVKVGAISDSGLKYGAIVELEADTSADATGQGLNADKSFIFTESKIGKFEFGNNMAANQKMKVGPAMFARATGGINGKYLEHINAPMLAHSSQVASPAGVVCSGGVGVDAAGSANTTNTCSTAVKLPRFILIPQSPVAHGGYAKGFYNRATDNEYATDSNGNIDSNYGSFNRNRPATAVSGSYVGYKNGSFGQMEDATKISYYSPRINGWQIGASFTPDTGDNGTSAVISGADSGDIDNVISGGINYSNSFGNLGFAMSATGEKGTYENSKITPVSGTAVKRNDLDSYDAGIMFTYFGFTVGGSYGSWGDSLTPKTGIYSCDYDSSLALANQDCSGTSTSIKKYKGANYYTLGGAYEFGPFAASITHMKSEFQKNSYTATSFGIDYRMARGLMPYLEYTNFSFTSNKPKASDVGATTQLIDNRGSVLLGGFLLAF